MTAHRTVTAKVFLIISLVATSEMSLAQMSPFPGGNYGSALCLNYGGFGGYGGGGYGGGYGMPGSGADHQMPVDVNNRPTMGVACTYNPEYDCPLFENRPHEAINQAIDALTAVMSTTSECKEFSNSGPLMADNARILQSSLGTLQTYMQAPGISTIDPSVLQSSVNAALGSANTIGQIFSSNTLLQSRCGRQVMSTGKVLLALTDILNGLSPYALMAAAVAPQIGVAAKFAISGGAIATSTIANLVNMIQQGTVDMTNADHRKAVLKNTCLYWKIAKKATFLQLAQSNQIQSVTDDLEKSLALTKARFDSISGDVKDEITYHESIERYTGSVDTQMRKDQFEMAALEAEAAPGVTDDLALCLHATELVHASAQLQSNVFPVTVINNLNAAVCLAKAAENPPPDPANPYGGLTPVFPVPTPLVTPTPTATPPAGAVATNPATPPVAAPGTNPNPWGGFPSPVAAAPPVDPRTCVPDQGYGGGSVFPGAGGFGGAYGTMPIVQNARANSLRTLNDISRRQLAALEPRVLQSEMDAIKLCGNLTRSWINSLSQSVKLTGTLINDQRVKVDAQLSKNPEYAAWASQDRKLKQERTTISRVAKVLEELRSDNSVIDRSEMDQRMKTLQNALFGRSGIFSMNHSPVDAWLEHTMKIHGARLASFATNLKSLQQGAAQLGGGGGGLDNITLDRVPVGSHGHEITCQLLQTTWLNWSAAIDHLGATEFMCNMITENLDDTTEKAITVFCRGAETLDGKSTVLSKLEQAKKLLVADPRVSGQTYKYWAQSVGEKLRQMHCPMPPVTVMN